MKSKASQSQGLLLFRLSQAQMFAMGTLKVQEIVPFTSFTAMPYSQQHVLGAVCIRGMTMPLIDMPSAIGYRPISREEFANCSIIITDCSRTTVGFLVRGIDKITACDWQAIAPPPETLGNNTYVTGITKVEDHLVQLLDVELILSHLNPDDPSTLYPTLTDIDREKLKPMRILLVDDSGVARRQLCNALDSINIPYFVATNGNDALDIMQKSAQAGHAVDILVSDIEMPGLDGYELAFEVQNTPHLAHTYMILHTSLSSEICVERALQVGAHEALTKFEANELVHAMLRGAKKRREATATV
ncbi:chemotaxis protein [Photobacterium kagoshimensis]|uniref:chemotaxis protein n=1 Tax=Photobacterium kagoshimensis TaxID=2910242 RepID=UPI003D140521